MAKRKLLVSLKKGETENGFSRHVPHERHRMRAMLERRA